jgi:alpha-beta hydrolase superfamily lysophospholipase
VGRLEGAQGMSLSGSRVGSTAPSPRAPPPVDLTQLDGWLQASEAAFTDLRPGTNKGIVWQGADRQRRPWAVVYLHGYSASRLETAPLAEVVGQALGAHVFYTRLTGHGRSGPAMAEAWPQDWMADTVEAMRIGNLLGHRVLLMSCSTGATLATWLGTSALGSRVAAHVFLSPNFGLKDWRGELVNWPWGRRLVLTMAGESRGWVPESEAEALAWTSRYPTRAVFPMMALVKAVRDSDLTSFQAPVLVHYSEQDQTVSPARIKTAFARLGSPLKQLVPVGYSQSKGQHVLAGAIMDPAAVAPMAEGIVRWVSGLGR